MRGGALLKRVGGPFSRVNHALEIDNYIAVLRVYNCNLAEHEPGKLGGFHFFNLRGSSIYV